ncbi:MAG: lipopolysaccharide biosynthesis protein [Acidobacteriota bacterium]
MTETVRRVATGAGWLYAYRWGERLIDLISIVVLARLLAPEDFGLVAIAASIVAIIEGLSDFDVNKALIRTRDTDPDGERALFDTAWTLAALRGLISALVMVTIAAFLSDSRVAAVLAVLALSPLLRGFANPVFVAFERDLIYSKLAALTLGARLVTFAVTLGVAWLTRSYWALVVGILAGSLSHLLLTYAMRPYRPRISLARAPEIFAFSGWMSLTTIVTTLSMETDKLIVGRFLGVADTGLYFMTQRVGVLPTRELVSPLQRILFPSFREIADDAQRLRRVVRESINVLGSLSLPAGCGFALVAADFVPLALGAEWQPIVPLLMILTPFLGLRGTLSMALPCMMALGETRLLFRVSLLYALVHVPAFIWGTVTFGLRGAFGAIVAAGFLYTAQNAWMLHRVLGISVDEMLRELVRPLVATLAMVAGVLALATLEPMAPAPAWLALAAKIAVGGGIFLATQLLLWRLAGRPAGIERRVLQVLARR